MFCVVILIYLPTFREGENDFLRTLSLWRWSLEWIPLLVTPILQTIGMKVKVLVVESCLILCDSMDCNLLGSSVHGILQARILEWVHSHLQGSSQSGDRTRVSCIAGRFFTIWATRKPKTIGQEQKNLRHTWGSSETRPLKSLGISRDLLLSQMTLWIEQDLGQLHFSYDSGKRVAPVHCKFIYDIRSSELLTTWKWKKTALSSPHQD